MEKVVTDMQPGQLQYISLSTSAVLSAQIVASGKLLREFIIENLFFHAVCLGGVGGGIGHRAVVFLY